jgi:hypothetical protein
MGGVFDTILLSSASLQKGCMGMRRTVLLLTSTALVVLLSCGVALAWSIDEAEPNDSIAQAQSIDSYFSLDNDPNIVSSTTVPHATPYGAYDGTRDFYSFTVNPAGVNTTGTFDIDGARPSFDAYVTLYDANGNWLREDYSNDTADPGSADSSDPYLEYTFPKAGTYYVAVGRDYGDYGAYRLHLSVQGATMSDTQPADTTPPQTILTQTPYAFSRNVSPSFGFASSDPNATFECKSDGAVYRACSSPKQYFLLSEGQHTFSVRATDAANNTDPSPAEYSWTVDSIDPKITFTEKPDVVTNDRTPTWAWTVEDANPDTYSECDLYDYTNDRDIFSQSGCASPVAFGAELPDGEYEFSVSVGDKAGNYTYRGPGFEVDNVPPKIISVKPTGRRVSRYTSVKVTFDDYLYNSGQFVNIYKRGSNKPLDVYRYFSRWGDRAIEIDTKNSLRRDTWYTVKVTTGVNDGANNLEAPKTWSFKTR